jgi:hypothetical protein
MDVIRFGESQGFERNKLRPNAWKYRDWLVNAFNRDLPYDEFVRLQIAGDVLRPDDPLAVIAAGFLVMGPYDLTTYTDGTAMMRAAAREEELEGLVGTASMAFLGLTIQCARCHDHKFDPITQKEYYQIAASLGGIYHGDERESLTAAGRETASKAREALDERLKPLRAKLSAIESGAKVERTAEVRASRAEKGLLALYRFPGTEARAIPDSAGAGGTLKLASTDYGSISRDSDRFKVRAPALLTSESPSTRIVDACKATNEITVEAWIAPANSTQTGPARIISLSSGTGERNFTLAQLGDRFDVRLRTTATDANGQPSLSSAEGTATTQPTHVVYTRNASGAARIFVNGKQSAELKAPGDFSGWNSEYKLVAVNETTRDRPWQGDLFLAALYSRALSAEEVQANFQADSGRFGVRGEADRVRALALLSPSARAEYQMILVEFTRLEAEMRLLAGGPAHLPVPKEPGIVHVLARGDFRQKGEPVTPRGIAAIRGATADWRLTADSPEKERRKGLAAWIAHPRNPLTARVVVNRIWSRYFGEGLVRTPSDFGRMGDSPSHPKLLDWLAAELVKPGDEQIPGQAPWSLKRIHRLILLSATYRQASRSRADAAQKDSDNRLVWRQNMRRLDAESVRDAVLTVSGELNRSIGGPGFRDWTVKSQGNNEIYTVIDAEGPEFNRRTLYRMVIRSGISPLLDALDCPDPSVATPRRTTTTTPIQALTLLNSAFMERMAARWAARLTRDAPEGVHKRISLAFRQAFGREALKNEIEHGVRFANRYGLPQYCLAMLNSNEFLYVD